VTLTVSAADVDLAMAEGSALLGPGCREREVGDGRVALDFWCPPPRVPPPDAFRVHLGAAGVAADVETALEGDEWRDAMRAFHRPVEIVGRLRVRPPWEPPRQGLLDVVVDPGMAFGTGQHTTTRGCIELLAGVEPGPLVDVGCGTGIIAIAARRLGHDPVWALDSDPLAVEATIANARANGVGLRVARRTLGRDRVPAAPTVVANLTATLLVLLARELVELPPTTAIVSGIRPSEVPSALAAFAPLGLREAARVGDDEWAALMLTG
jgi:ribosomal protein L11 methyltransferase